MMKKVIRLLVWAAMMGMAAFSLALGVSSATPQVGADIVLRVRSGATVDAVQSLAQVSEDVSIVIPDLGIYRLRSAQPERAVLRRLQRGSIILYAEPNLKVYLALTPNDPDYASRQWALPLIGAPQAWDIVTGSHPITIAIIDTGIDLRHPDLVSKLVTGATFVSGSILPQDDHGHGTHVAGIAAAATNNGIGMAGVSWGARLMPVKVVSGSGQGSVVELINGIYYAATYGAQVLNISLVTEGYSQAVQDAIDYAHGQGALIVASAGNCAQGGSGCSGPNPIMYPAAHNHVLSVAATDDRDRWASFSTYNAYVDVAAPGVGIYSTHWQRGVSTYFWMSGTSQAAPHVAGLAALVWSGRPWLSNDQVAAVIIDTARDVNAGQYPGRDDYLGAGRVDAQRAVDRTPPVSAVLPLPAGQRDPQILVRWSGQDENSGIRSYTVQYRDGQGPWTDWLAGVTMTQSIFLGVPGHTYYFRSRAVDRAGNVEDYPHGDGDAHIHVWTCMISGTIRDNRGVAVAGADVRLLPDGPAAVTDASGRYTLGPQDCEAVYDVAAERFGFSALPPMAGVVVTHHATLTGLDLYLPPADNVLHDRDWGFESGIITRSWSITGSVTPGLARGEGHTGFYAAIVGTPMTATGAEGESAVAITVTVPVTAYRPVLSFLYRLVTMDNESHDRFEVHINGSAVFRAGYPGLDYGAVRDFGWRHTWIDLTAYAGQAVALRFSVFQGAEYAAYPTAVYLDEVSIGSAAGGPHAMGFPVIVAER